MLFASSVLSRKSSNHRMKSGYTESTLRSSGLYLLNTGLNLFSALWVFCGWLSFFLWALRGLSSQAWASSVMVAVPWSMSPWIHVLLVVGLLVYASAVLLMF